MEPEGQFYLLCWDVLGAAEFRFNEAHLLGKAVGMDVDQLVAAGLVSKTGDKIKILSAKDRRRERALEPDEVIETLFGTGDGQEEADEEAGAQGPPERSAVPHGPRRLPCPGPAVHRGQGRGRRNRLGQGPRAPARLAGGVSGVARLMAALVNAAPEAVQVREGQEVGSGDVPGVPRMARDCSSRCLASSRQSGRKSSPHRGRLPSLRMRQRTIRMKDWKQKRQMRDEDNESSEE